MNLSPQIMAGPCSARVSPYLLSLQKRTLDITASLALLILFSPVILVVTVLIASSGDGAFYAQRRVGRQGRVFNCYKFRTMIPNADGMLRILMQFDEAIAQEWREHQKLAHDPRVTRIGRWLRATSLDEIPQLFNVLIGDMSMVGPRPFAEDQLAYYDRDTLEAYVQVSPGLTGPWQIYARHDTTFACRSRFDRVYYERASLLSDIKLMLKTPVAMLNGQ